MNEGLQHELEQRCYISAFLLPLSNQYMEMRVCDVRGVGSDDCIG